MSWWVSLSPPDLHYSQSCRRLTHPAVFAAQSVWASRWGSTFICSDNILTSTKVFSYSAILLLWCVPSGSVLCVRARDGVFRFVMHFLRGLERDI